MATDAATVYFCKVCNVHVPRRRSYQPRVCEACQKFFRRHLAHLDTLICTSGTNMCTVDADSRVDCYKCRIEKCIAVGMRRLGNAPKNMASTSSGSTSEPLPSDNRALLPRQPLLFDGAAVETTILNAVKAYTELHQLESLPLLFIGPSELQQKSDDWRQKGLDQVKGIVFAAIGYSKTFASLENLPIGDARLLVGGFVTPSFVLYQALNSCRGASPLAFHSSLMKSFLYWYPPTTNYLKAVEVNGALINHMALWDPSFPVVALLFAALFYQGEFDRMPNLVRKKRRLQLAIELMLNEQCRDNAARAATERLLFHQAVSLAEASARSLNAWCLTDLSKSPTFSKSLAILDSRALASSLEK